MKKKHHAEIIFTVKVEGSDAVSFKFTARPPSREEMLKVLITHFLLNESIEERKKMLEDPDYGATKIEQYIRKHIEEIEAIPFN